MRMRWMTVAVMMLTAALATPVAYAAMELVGNQAPGQKPPPPPPAPPATDANPGADAPPPPPASPAPDGRARRVGPNVRVEVTFTEQTAPEPARTKTVTVTTNDNTWGRVRGFVVTAGSPNQSPLNVDVRPGVQSDGRVLLELSIEYGDRARPGGAGPGQIVEMRLTESLTVLLDSGKPLTITQSADPVSDRKVTVEVKATVLR